MIEYKAKNIREFSELNYTRLLGYQGKLADKFFENRIFTQEAKDTAFAEAESAFRTQNDDETIVGYWRGEFWGKWIISACRVCKYSGNGELKKFLHEAALNLLTFQREDGYLGTYRDADRIFAADKAVTAPVMGWGCDWCWNIWCRKYTFWGLLEAYDLTGDPAILNGAVKMADHLIGQLKKLHVTLRDTGTFSGLPSCSIMKPMLVLYRITGEQKYLDLCLETADNWEREDGGVPNLIKNSLENRPVHTWREGDNWAKAYEMMSCVDGIIELYRVTGVEKYLTAAQNLWQNLFDYEQNVLFSVGYNDLFAQGGQEINAITEPCDVVHWLRISSELYALTGENKYLDAFERAYLNPFLASVFTDGKWGSRGVRSAGRHTVARQMDYIYNHCCVNNLPRGFMNAAQVSVMRGDDGLYVNLYTDFDYRDEKDTLTLRGSYTENCRTTLTLTHKGEEEKLFLRIPAWSKKNTIICNGVEYHPEAGERFCLTVPEDGQLTVEIALDNTPVVREFDKPIIKRIPGENGEWKIKRWMNLDNRPFQKKGEAPLDAMVFEPKCTILMGPMLLARANRIGCTKEEMFDSPSVWGKKAECALAERDGIGQSEFVATLTTETGEKVETKLCDYASAANFISDNPYEFSIWL